MHTFSLIYLIWYSCCHLKSILGHHHRVIILNRGSMFACQWREFSPPLSSAHRLLKCYHSQWEIGDVAISGNSPSALRHNRAISQWAISLEWRHAVTLYILVGKICISFSLFYCEGMLSLVVLWLCGHQRDNFLKYNPKLSTHYYASSSGERCWFLLLVMYIEYLCHRNIIISRKTLLQFFSFIKNVLKLFYKSFWKY